MEMKFPSFIIQWEMEINFSEGSLTLFSAVEAT